MYVSVVCFGKYAFRVNEENRKSRDKLFIPRAENAELVDGNGVLHVGN